jgi:hypothetical protein
MLTAIVEQGQRSGEGRCSTPISSDGFFFAIAVVLVVACLTGLANGKLSVGLCTLARRYLCLFKSRCLF